MEHVEHLFTELNVHRWTLQSTDPVSQRMAVNVANRTVEALGPKQWMKLFDTGTHDDPSIVAHEGRFGATFADPNHVNNQQRLKFVNTLLRTNYAHHSKELREKQNFTKNGLIQNFNSNTEKWLPYVVFSQDGVTLATQERANDPFKVNYPRVLYELGLQRFKSTEKTREEMHNIWRARGWGRYEEFYILLFAAWDEAKEYATSLLTGDDRDGRIKTWWKRKKRFSRMSENFPIDREGIKAQLAAEARGQAIEIDTSDTMTVISEAPPRLVLREDAHQNTNVPAKPDFLSPGHLEFKFWIQNKIEEVQRGRVSPRFLSGQNRFQEREQAMNKWTELATDSRKGIRAFLDKELFDDQKIDEARHLQLMQKILGRKNPFEGADKLDSEFHRANNSATTRTFGLIDKICRELVRILTI